MVYEQEPAHQAKVNIQGHRIIATVAFDLSELNDNLRRAVGWLSNK
jgi:hypothetical protein